jgi:hypothetical protein
MTESPARFGGDIAGVRSVKLARLRVGVFASGAPVGERQQPPRSVHVVDISDDLDAPKEVTAYCGARFAPGTLAEVPWGTLAAHKLCYERSLVEMSHPRINRATTSENVTDDTDNDHSVTEESSARAGIQVTAQWSVNDPVIYVNHATGSAFVDLAVSGSGNDDAIARFQIRDPVDVVRAGRKLIRAGLSLAETCGMDINRLNAATPPVWWPRDQAQPDANVTDAGSPVS